MDSVYDLHRHTHCVIMYIGKAVVSTSILPNSNRHFDSNSIKEVQLGSSISYSRNRTDVKALGEHCKKDAEDNILIDNFYDVLYHLFKKGNEARDEEDKFLMKAISDYLPLAVENTVEENKLKIESFDLFHYAFIVPSEWEEEMREDIIRPIFVQSGLISNEDHLDRLLFFSDIESICYGSKVRTGQAYSFKRGQNTILCRLSPGKSEIAVKFDLIQTTTTLFNFPDSKLFPKVMRSSSVFVNIGDAEGRIENFLRTNLFPVATDGGAVRKSWKSKLVRKLQKLMLASADQDLIIRTIIRVICRWRFGSLEEESKETKLWVTYDTSWNLSEVQKKFIQSLCPSIICTVINVAPFGDINYITLSNSLKSYEFLLLVDMYNNPMNIFTQTLYQQILECYRRSLNCTTATTKIKLEEYDIKPSLLLYGAGKGVFEAVQNSDIYCKPRIEPSEDLNTSSSVFLNSKPDVIVNFDISLGSTLFTCSLLDEDGFIEHVFNHDDLIGDNLPPLGHFFTFSNTTTLNVKNQFITFAKRYLLGNLTDFTADGDIFTEKELVFEVKAILNKELSNGEVLVSTNEPKYIIAFILMYMVYIKEEIWNKLPDHLISDHTDTKNGYAISIEAIILNNTIGNKDNLRDLIYASGLVPKDNDFKKLRITTQGERILPAIQKSLKLEFTLRSYFLVCQLHENYVQLSLHQVVTASTSEEKEQESIIVQDEILAIPNIYDSLCASMWLNLAQDSSLIEFCEMHNTSDDNKILDLFSSKTKKEFFTILRAHISDNLLQNNPGAQSTMDTYAVKLNNSCNCRIHLKTADIIDISFTPVLQDIACNLYGSLLNKVHFGNYMNIDYLFSFIRFSSNPQLQYAFARILEEEAVDFNLELGIDTCCLLVPELFSQLTQPVIAQRPLCYKDFKIGALKQVYSENYVFSIERYDPKEDFPLYKYKRTDTKTIECDWNIGFPLINKGETINNVRPNRTFYLSSNKNTLLSTFFLVMSKFGTMNYLENTETLDRADNPYQYFDRTRISSSIFFKDQDVEVPVMISVNYISYTSSLQFFIKVVGADTRVKYLAGVMEASEPLTLTRF